MTEVKEMKVWSKVISIVASFAGARAVENVEEVSWETERESMETHRRTGGEV